MSSTPTKRPSDVIDVDALDNKLLPRTKALWDMKLPPPVVVHRFCGGLQYEVHRNWNGAATTNVPLELGLIRLPPQVKVESKPGERPGTTVTTVQPLKLPYDPAGMLQLNQIPFEIQDSIAKAKWLAGRGQWNQKAPYESDTDSDNGSEYKVNGEYPPEFPYEWRLGGHSFLLGSSGICLRCVLEKVIVTTADWTDKGWKVDWSFFNGGCLEAKANRHNLVVVQTEDFVPEMKMKWVPGWH